MQVYSGTYVSLDDVHDGNTPIVHVCTDEQSLVDALLQDIGDCMTGITATSLAELSELLQDYSEDARNCIAYSVSTL